MSIKTAIINLIKPHTREANVRGQVLGPVLRRFADEISRVLSAYRSNEPFELSYNWSRQVSGKDVQRMNARTKSNLRLAGSHPNRHGSSHPQWLGRPHPSKQSRIGSSHPSQWLGHPNPSKCNWIGDSHPPRWLGHPNPSKCNRIGSSHPPRWLDHPNRHQSEWAQSCRLELCRVVHSRRGRGLLLSLSLPSLICLSGWTCWPQNLGRRVSQESPQPTR